MTTPRINAAPNATPAQRDTATALRLGRVVALLLLFLAVLCPAGFAFDAGFQAGAAAVAVVDDRAEPFASTSSSLEMIDEAFDGEHASWDLRSLTDTRIGADIPRIGTALTLGAKPWLPERPPRYA